jgi:hypothetical protein
MLIFSFSGYSSEFYAYDKLQTEEVKYWNKVDDSTFDDTATSCSELTESGTQRSSRARLEQCQAINGNLRLTASTLTRLGIVRYPATYSVPSLLDDFYVETRFRQVNSSLSACALMLAPTNGSSEQYFRLDARPTDEYPGFGAQLVSYDMTNGKDKVWAASGSTLPHVDRPAFFEEEASSEGAWVMLGIARQGNSYRLFVNRRLVAVYESPSTAIFVRAHAAVIAGDLKNGGRATCEFDYFKVYSKP